jgi:predicted small secreted protein
MSRHTAPRTIGRTLSVAAAVLALAACGATTGGAGDDPAEGVAATSLGVADPGSTAPADGTATSDPTATTGATGDAGTTVDPAAQEAAEEAAQQAAEQRLQQALTAAEQALGEAEQMVSSIDGELNSAASAAANGG